MRPNTGQARLVRSVGVGIVALIVISATQAATRYVDDSVTTSGDGTTWATAKKKIQELTSLAAGDIIRVARGTYKPDAQGSPIQLVSQVSIQGGYYGPNTESIDPDLRNPALYVSTITGDLNGDDGANFTNITDNAYIVISVPASCLNPGGNPFATGPNVANLDGFVIKGGNSPSGSGAGINVGSSATPVIRGCKITLNRAGLDGGGVATSANSHPVFRNCEISDNVSLGSGGGFALGDDLTVLNCTVKGNTASNSGGGISTTVSSVALNIISSTFSDNHAGSTITGGGAIFVKSSIAPAVQLVNCAFVKNTSNSNGGALMLDNVTLTMTGCTVADNTAGITDFGAGGGLYWYGPASTVKTSIFWDNTADSDAQIEADPGLTVTFTDVEGGWSGTGNKNQDPLFISAASGNYQLICGSPCINTGSDPFVPADGDNVDEDSSTTEPIPDRDLKWRTTDVADMGAYEKQPGASCPGDVFPAPCGDGAINIDDLLLVINTWTSGPDCNTVPCGGNGNGDNVVNIDDLLLVINYWGTCTLPSDAPQTVQDCINICSEAPTPEKYQECMNGCLLAIEQ